MSGDISLEQPLSVMAAHGLWCLLIVERECLVLVQIWVLTVLSYHLIMARSNVTAFCVFLHATVVIFGSGDNCMLATVVCKIVCTGKHFKYTVVRDLVKIKEYEWLPLLLDLG